MSTPTILDGFDGLGAMFGLMADRIEEDSYESQMAELVPYIQECERQAFLGQHTPGGEEWAPLSPATIAMKGRRSGHVAPHSTILIDTGRLFESLTVDGGTSDTIQIVGENFLTFGTSVPYAIFHVLGTDKMPARDPVGINDATADRIADSVGGFVVDKLMGA